MSCPRCNNTDCTCHNYGGGYSIIGKALKNYRLESPIPEEVRDLSKLQNWFRKTGYIPFAGTQQDSNHTYLRYLLNLANLSPTLASCINGIRFYAFTGKPNIIKSVDSEFDFADELKSEDLSLDQKKSFVQKLSSIDKGNMSWTELAINLYNSFKSSGNAFMSVTIKKVIGESFVSFQYHNPETVLYKIPTLFTSNKVDVSLSWDTQYLKRFPPKTFSIFPYYDESETEITTMFHLKSGTGHYGRPDWIACSHDAFLEVKNKEYLLKAVHNNFTGQVLIEFEGQESRSTLDDKEAQDNGWEGAADRWAGNFTSAGGSKELVNPQSILITERPAGATPVHVHEFAIHTKEKYFQTIGEIVERNIIKTNMWSKNLSGVDNAGGFSTDAFISELKAKIPIIKYFQDKIDNHIINRALDFVGQKLEDPDYIDYNIVHKGVSETILNDANVTDKSI